MSSRLDKRFAARSSKVAVARQPAVRFVSAITTSSKIHTVTVCTNGAVIVFVIFEA